MNRLDSSTVCRVCGLDMAKRKWRCGDPEMARQWDRMIDNGVCDDCQSDRMEAVQEYIAAADEVRLIAAMAGGCIPSRPTWGHLSPLYRQARERLDRATAWCVRLKMWSERPRTSARGQ